MKRFFAFVSILALLPALCGCRSGLPIFGRVGAACSAITRPWERFQCGSCRGAGCPAPGCWAVPGGQIIPGGTLTGSADATAPTTITIPDASFSYGGREIFSHVVEDRKLSPGETLPSRVLRTAPVSSK